jgi:predicted PurR-regulated permease PerM
MADARSAKPPATPAAIGFPTPSAFPRWRTPSRPALVAATAVAGLIVLGIQSFSAVQLGAVALVLAFVLDPVVTWLARRGVARSLAAALVVATATLFAMAASVLIVIRLVEQSAALAAAVPTWLADAERWYRVVELPTAVRMIIDLAAAEASHLVERIDIGAISLDLVGDALNVVGLGFGVLPFLVFFIVAGRPRTVAALRASMPEPWRADLTAISGLGVTSLATYVRSEAILAGLVGATTWLGLTVLAGTVDPRFADVAIVFGFVAAAAELVPMIGPWIAFVPAVAFAATIGPMAVLATAALYLVISIIEGQILVPKIEGKHFDFHPAAIVMVLFIGQAVAGPLGAILAVPVAAAATRIYAYVFSRSTGLDPAAALRRVERGSDRRRAVPRPGRLARWRAALVPARGSRSIGAQASGPDAGS